MSYWDVVKINHGDDTKVRGPYAAMDGYMLYDAFEVLYKPGHPPDSFEFDGKLYKAIETEDECKI